MKRLAAIVVGLTLLTACARPPEPSRAQAEDDPPATAELPPGDGVPAAPALAQPVATAESRPPAPDTEPDPAPNPDPAPQGGPGIHLPPARAAVYAPDPIPVARDGAILTFGPDGEVPNDLHVSPGGRRAAYTRSKRQPDGSLAEALFVVDLDRLDARTVVSRPGRPVQAAADAPPPTLPQGRRLYLVDWIDDRNLALITQEPGRSVASLEVVDAVAGDGVARLELPASMIRGFTMVAGRNRLVVHDYPGKAWEIDLMNPRAPAWRLLFGVQTEHKQSDAALFREGTSFFFIARDGLYVGDSASGLLRRVEAGDAVGLPMPSPDGQRLAAPVANSGGHAVPLRVEGATLAYGDRVVVVNRDGQITAEHRAPAGGGELYALGPWAPDGGAVVLRLMRNTGCPAAGMNVRPLVEQRGLLLWTPGSPPQTVALGLERMEVETRFAGPDRLVVLTRSAAPPQFPPDQPGMDCRQRAAAAAAERAREASGNGSAANVRVQIYDARSGTLRDDPAGLIPLPVADAAAAGLAPGEALVVDPSGQAHLLTADGKTQTLGWRAGGPIGDAMVPRGFLSARGESGRLIVTLEAGDGQRLLLLKLREDFTPHVPVGPDEGDWSASGVTHEDVARRFALPDGRCECATVRVSTVSSEPGRALVRVRLDGVLDDSIAVEEYLVTLERLDGRWRIGSATRAMQCRRGASETGLCL